MHSLRCTDPFPKNELAILLCLTFYFNQPLLYFHPSTKLLQQNDFLSVPRQLSSVKVRMEEGVIKVHNQGKRMKLNKQKQRRTDERMCPL